MDTTAADDHTTAPSNVADGSPAASMAADEHTSVSTASVPIDDAAEPSERLQTAEPAPDGASKGRPIAPSDAHVVVIQPDNELNVGVNMAKCVRSSRAMADASIVSSRASCFIYAACGTQLHLLLCYITVTGSNCCAQVGSLSAGAQQTPTSARAVRCVSRPGAHLLAVICMLAPRRCASAD